MAQRIILKKSSVADKVPLATDLEYGELAINYTDGLLYYKDSTNNVSVLNSAGGTTSDSFKTISVSGGTSVVADSPTDTLTLVASTGISISADSATDTLTFSNTGVTSVDGQTGAITPAILLSALNTVDGTGSGLDADLLDGQNGSYYLDWTNTTNKPDPVITVTLTGDVTGTANTTLTDLASGTVSVSTTIAANSVALGTDTTGNYVAGVAAGSYILVTGTAGEGWSPTIAVDASSANTASKVVARDAAGNFSAGQITANAIVIDSTVRDYATITTAATTQVTLASFAAATYGSGEFLIQATQGTARHITKLLLVHNSTTADATEYGTIITGTSLFSVSVDISSGSVRVLITPAAATSTVFKASYTLIGA